MFKSKKIIVLLATILLGLLSLFLYNNPTAPNIHSKSAILIDASNGNVLFEKDASTSYPVASMSKLMTVYIVLDHIENGSVDWNDQVIISRNANNIGNGAVMIPVDGGDSLTVRELFKAMVVSSANNATIALAEYIAGTEENFTQLMNEKASNLGLSNQTHFVNATGLPNPTMNNEENKMSANDVATLAYHLLKDHSHDVLETATLQSDHIQSHGIDLFSTNKMLNPTNRKTYFKGMDGLKTGFTDAAGYNFVGTAFQKDKRLISVIINADSDDSRFIETKKLLSYGFGKPILPFLNGEMASVLEKIKATIRRL